MKSLSVNVPCYGKTLNVMADYNAFHKAVLQSQTVDHAGATTNQEVAEILNQLHARWDRFLESEFKSWQAWANRISMLPANQCRTAVNSPPPVPINRLFTTTPTAAEQNVQSLRQNVGIS